MNEKELKSIGRMNNLCNLAGIDFIKFLEDTEIKLKNRIKNLLNPNEIWFREGKSFKRYWKFLEKITKHQWEYTKVEYWYKLLRGPSETREDISPSLKYQVLSRDKSTCQKCGSKAPDIKLEVDHIIPWACGGSTHIDNLQTLCDKCNKGKSNEYFEGGN